MAHPDWKGSIPDIQKGWREGPFGTLEPSREDVHNREVIRVDGVFDSAAGGVNKDIKVIVGRKGSGKTLYLLQIRDKQLADGHVAFPTETLPTRVVISAHEALSQIAILHQRGVVSYYIDGQKYLSSLWRELWEKAFLMSWASALFAKNHWEGGSNPLLENADEMFPQFREDFAEIIKIPPIARGPGTWISHIVETYRGNQLRSFLNNSLWSDLRQSLAAILKKCPPLGIFIDAVDDEFEVAPEPWLRCQQGLFHSVFQWFYAQNDLSKRAHIVITLRESVFNSIIQSDHATRYVDNERVKNLHWNRRSIRAFFLEKISRLGARKITGARSSRYTSFDDWLGFSDVQSLKRNVPEAVSDYVIRHTRMLPRDVILIGNAVSGEIASRHDRGKAFEAPSLRKQVHEVGVVLARESRFLATQERIASSEFVARMIEESGPNGQLIEQLAHHEQYKFDRLVAGLENEIFSYEKLREVLQQVGLADQYEFEGGGDDYFRFDQILWRHGLLGQRSSAGGRDKWRYAWDTGFGSNRIPEETGALAWHCTVIDLFPHIKTSPDEIPF